MKRTILILFLLFPLSLFSKNLVYNWFWGIERIDHNDYFILDLRPEFHYSLFHLKLDIPVEVNSNWTLYREQWNDSKEDIVSKIEYFTVTNKNGFIRLSGLKNVSLGNKELVWEYRNDLFEPFQKKRGLSSLFSFRSFNFQFIMDDLVRYERFFFQADYRTKRLETGMAYGLDRPASADKIDLFLNYHFFQRGEWDFFWPGDYVQDLRQKAFFSSGLGMQYGPHIRFINKIKYFREHKSGAYYFGPFYVLSERRSSTDKLGFSSELKFDFFRFFSFELQIQKSGYHGWESLFLLRTGRRFPSRILCELEIVNRENTDWYDAFLETERNTILSLRSGIPLSRNLWLKLDYLKNFSGSVRSLRGVHTLLFYSEFIF
ncbi:MAG: hypothetical protein PHF84_05950 [bacterium]|nr:hypothetical protein [bacterium]